MDDDHRLPQVDLDSSSAVEQQPNGRSHGIEADVKELNLLQAWSSVRASAAWRNGTFRRSGSLSSASIDVIGPPVPPRVGLPGGLSSCGLIVRSPAVRRESPGLTQAQCRAPLRQEGIGALFPGKYLAVPDVDRYLHLPPLDPIVPSNN